MQRNHLKACYSPPAHQPEPQKPKRIGYPLTDQQILRLLDGVPDERWRFAIQLAATYGLRPEDIRHLRWRDGEVWSLYRKSQGGLRGAKTEPRRLHALPVEGAPDWNLAGRLKIGEELPPLRSDGKGGQAFRQYLGRREVWKARYRRKQRRLVSNIGAVFVSGIDSARKRIGSASPFWIFAAQWGTASKCISRTTAGLCQTAPQLHLRRALNS